MKTAKLYHSIIKVTISAAILIGLILLFGFPVSAAVEEEDLSGTVTGNAAAENAIASYSEEYVGLAENQATLEDWLIELQRQITWEKEQLEDSDRTVSREELAQQTCSETWGGSVLTKDGGVNVGPSGKETYYNLNMDTIVSTMESMGIESDYWVRNDGVKMYGDYIMCAADLSVYPRGSIIETSLGTAIVCDTGSFVYCSDVAVDIATAW